MYILNFFSRKKTLFFCGEKSVADKYNQLLTADAKQDADLQKTSLLHLKGFSVS